MRKRYRIRFWPFSCLAFLPCSSALGEALLPERFDFENGELTQASSNRWTPPTTVGANPNLNVVDGQLAWDFTGQVADPVNNGYYDALFASSGINSGSFHTHFNLEVLEAPFGAETTAGIVPALLIGADGRLVNLSTRALVETGEAVMIGGFIIEDGPRQVLIQALGPELANRGISNVLADPVLTVIQTSEGNPPRTPLDPPIEIMVNDNWEDSQGQLVSDLWKGSPPLAEDSPSSAAVLTLEPGEYTAKVEGKDGMAGVAIVEVFGIDSAGADGRLVNLSTRALVETGEAVMIGGFIIEDGPRQVLIQALGPELANRGISNALADPVLTVIQTSEGNPPRTPLDPPIEIMVNDNWEDSQGQLVFDLWEGSPPLAEDSPSSAAVLTLEPGEYTAKVEGKDGTAGVAIVEVFGIDSVAEEDPFARWNDLEPESWWTESAPYSCHQEKKKTSPWLSAGLMDLGGSDSLSLIRYFGNGSYLRYGFMGFSGCTALHKYPDSFYLDPPADPTYYSLGDLDIHVDIARVPEDATGWFMDDGSRVDMSMDEAVELMNTFVAAYYRRISQDRFRITFHAGNEFDVPGDGSPIAADDELFRLVGACLEGCAYGAPGGLNRIRLSDVSSDTGGGAYNGWAHFGLASFRDGNMETIVHEIGHGWMFWPHSFAEVPWRPSTGRELQGPNPYSNFYDIMSRLGLYPMPGWSHDLPSTLAINRYTAGWIDPEDVALHLVDSATYTLSKPFEEGSQFLVIHSGRRFAFTTLEVLEERTEPFKILWDQVYDPSAPTGLRPCRYEGVLVSRYDQTAGTGTYARFGPALYNEDNPDFLTHVGSGRDDLSLIPDGGSREIGGGVSVSVAKNPDGSYEVTVSGGRVASFERWCDKIWFSGDEYDTGCFLDEAVWE